MRQGLQWRQPPCFALCLLGEEAFDGRKKTPQPYRHSKAQAGRSEKPGRRHIEEVMRRGAQIINRNACTCHSNK